jgi:hypothetical protein
MDEFYTIHKNDDNGYMVVFEDASSDPFTTIGDALLYGMFMYPGRKAYIPPNVKRKPEISGQYDPNKTWERRQRK